MYLYLSPSWIPSEVFAVAAAVLQVAKTADDFVARCTSSVGMPTERTEPEQDRTSDVEVGAVGHMARPGPWRVDCASAGARGGCVADEGSVGDRIAFAGNSWVGRVRPC